MTKEQKILKKYVAKIKSGVRLWSEDHESELDRYIAVNLESYAKEVNQEQPTEEQIRNSICNCDNRDEINIPMCANCDGTI